MKVRVNSIYRFEACLLDIVDARDNTPERGQIVRVVNLPGCPKANTMGHCHVVNAVTGEFIGLVCTGSLEPASAATKRRIRKAVR